MPTIPLTVVVVVGDKGHMALALKNCLEYFIRLQGVIVI